MTIDKPWMAILSLVGLPLCGTGADWNEWRGPLRNGVAAESPALLNSWPTNGPALVWTSHDRIQGSDRGGYGSVVVADGRVFVLETPQHQEPVPTRTLTENNLKALGWLAAMPPAELVTTMEEARLSDERAGLKDPKAIQEWSRQWTTNRLDAEQQKMFSRFVSDRLNAGKGALDLATIEKLSSIKDKEFATQQELDNWFAENGVESDVRNKIAARIPTAVAVGNDVVFCLDAGDGKTLWKATFPGAPQPHAASSTPCVIGGRCYVIGSDSDCRCLDAGTGALIWQKKVGKGANNASFMVIDGVAIIPAGPLAGIDALTGNLRWSHDKIGAGNASPVPWISGGRTNAIVRAGRALTCLDPRTGSILWTVSDSAGGDFAGATPAVEGDIMAVSCNDSVAIYRLAPDKAALLGNVKCPMDYSSSPIVVNGHAYVFGRNGSACISIEKASLVWENKELKAGSYLAPVAADGKVFTQGHGTGYGSGDLVMLAVSPDGGRQMASAPIKQVLCTTPALADGRAYCRLNSGVACYDLRTTAMAGSATAH